MRIGMMLNYSGGFEETVAEVGQLEAAGLDIIFVPEAYSFDAVSQLGYLAAKTSTIGIASGIFQIYTRTPSLVAMTCGIRPSIQSLPLSSRCPTSPVRCHRAEGSDATSRVASRSVAQRRW